MSRRSPPPPPPRPRRAPPPRRHRHSRRLVVVFSTLAAVMVVVCVAAAGLVYGKLETRPVTAAQGDGVVVSVHRGESLVEVADALASQGLSRSSTWFAAAARLDGIRLRAGRYLISSGMGASEIVAVLEGTSYCPAVSITTPPGFTAAQIATRVAATRGMGVTRQQYLAALNEGGYTAPILAIRPPGDTSLEGFLFPDTYTVTACSTARQIVQAQLDDAQRRLAPLLPSSVGAAYADLIKASIVQVEVAPRDFATGASVIDNRLALPMRLQIDSTVMYGLGMAGRPMSGADEAVDTPYNSYLNPGLPPTPIDNPDLAALQAVLRPAQTDYLFYVSDACGNTYFSATEAVHEQQVREYLGKCP